MGLLIAGVGWVLTELGRPMLGAIAQASTTQFLLRVILLLVAVLILGGAYILHLRSQIRKPLSSKFDFDEFGGFYIDRKTHRGVCARCLANGIIIHLMDVGSSKMCNACKTAYRSKENATKG